MPRDIRYEGIIIENGDLREDWQFQIAFPEDEVTIPSKPAGVTEGVASETYNAYRQGRDSACVDMVIMTRLEGGRPAVLLSLRSESVCYANKWWIHGGALQAYQGIADFISDRAKRECGVKAEPMALIGVYRTCAEDFVGSTLQPCYVTYVPVEIIRQFMGTDDRHQRVELFTAEDLEKIEPAKRHWYPMRVAKLALKAMD